MRLIKSASSGQQRTKIIGKLRKHKKSQLGRESEDGALYALKASEKRNLCKGNPKKQWLSATYNRTMVLKRRKGQRPIGYANNPQLR